MLKIQRISQAIGTAVCSLVMIKTAHCAELRGEKFVAASRDAFTLLKMNRAVDFNLYEIKLDGHAVAKLYEGDNPDFPYGKATSEPVEIAGRTTLLSTPRTLAGNQAKCDHLVQFSGCDSLCTIHVWYEGLTASQADKVDAFVRTIRRKQ